MRHNVKYLMPTKSRKTTFIHRKRLLKVQQSKHQQFNSTKVFTQLLKVSFSQLSLRAMKKKLFKVEVLVLRLPFSQRRNKILNYHPKSKIKKWYRYLNWLKLKKLRLKNQIPKLKKLMKKFAVKVDLEVKSGKIPIIVGMIATREDRITTTRVVDKVITENKSTLRDMKVVLVTTMNTIEDHIISTIKAKGLALEDTVVINVVINDFNLIKYGN